MIDIIFTSWITSIERLAYLIVTIQSVKRQSRLERIEHKLHLALEYGSKYENEIIEFCRKENVIFYPKDTKPSLGSMMKFAHEIGNYPYIMFMQDDWYMHKALNVNRCVSILEKDPSLYVLRLRNSRMGEAIARGNGLYDLDPTLHSYYWSDNPHIKKRSYHEATGPFGDSMVNGFDHAQSENKMNNKAKELGVAGTHKIICTDNIYFQHIGDFEGCTTLSDRGMGNKCE